MPFDRDASVRPRLTVFTLTLVVAFVSSMRPGFGQDAPPRPGPAPAAEDVPNATPLEPEEAQGDRTADTFDEGGDEALDDGDEVDALDDGAFDEGFDDEEPAEVGSSELRVSPSALATWRTERIDRARLETFAGGSIADALQFQTGVRVENECSLCNSSSVRLGGLPGAHTVVLVDGVPLIGALGSVYGLLLLDAALVESVEVRRGPSPASPAGAATSVGTIDLRTRRADAGFAELRMEAGAPGLARMAAVAGHAADAGDAIVAVTVDHRSPLDRDGDGVTEQAGADRVQGMMIGRRRLGDAARGHARVQHLQESRQGGWLQGGVLRSVTDEDRSALVETILTQRTEAASGVVWRPRAGRTLSLTGAGTRHAQSSNYGGEVYDATQWTGFAEVRWVEALTPSLRVESGASWRGEWLAENVALSPRSWQQPGAFGDLTWSHGRGDVSAAMRVDWHNRFGTFLVPALRTRLDLTRSWSVLATVGRGARTPVTFFEQFQGVRPEGYRLVYDADRPERTTTAGVGLQGNVGTKLLVTASAQASRVENAMTFGTDEDDAGVGQVVVFQSGEALDVLSLEGEVQAWAWRGGELTAAWTTLFFRDPGGAIATPTSEQQGYARLTQSTPSIDMEWMVRARVSGPADLRAVFGDRWEALGRDPSLWLADSPQPGVAYDDTRYARARSPWFGVIDLRATWIASRAFDLYAGVDNVLDFHQTDVERPLFFADTPAGPAFDVINVWGPTRGRFVYGGFVWRLPTGSRG